MVGGGPAGLIAAEVLAGSGVQVTVYDRMPALGRKLMLAGRGGLNLTHSEPGDALIAKYGPASDWLAPLIDAFSSADLVAWCEGLGQATFVGSSGRVFPTAMRAGELLAAWEQRLAELGVTIRLRHRWTGWTDDGSLRFTVDERGGEPVEVTVTPDATVLALGGGSWPTSGSDGAWIAPLTGIGVSIEPFRPANSGFVVEWSDVMLADFAGEPVKNVRVSAGDESARGELMITDAGLEGGALYAVSRELTQACVATGSAVLTVDLLPDVDETALAERIAGARSKDSTASVLTRRVGLDRTKVALLRESTGNAVPKGEALAALLKALPITVHGPVGLDRAISTSGGVRLDALDDHLMLADRTGVFLAGEMLDWDAPTGGYLLQACFSTGVAAAAGVLAWLDSAPER